MRNHTALASCAFGSASPSFFFSRPARPQASTSQRASARRPVPCRVQATACGAPPPSATVDLAHQRVGLEADALANRLLGQEVLEQAAVDLVGRHRQRPAGADLGHAVDVAPAVGEEEAEAELLQLAALEVLLQAEHVAK